MEFFLKNGLKDEQTVRHIIFQFLLTDHHQQILQKIREVNVKVQLHDFPDPAKQKLPHFQIHGLHFQLQDVDKFRKVELFSVVVHVQDYVFESTVQELA